MTPELRESMRCIVGAARHAWNLGVISGPGMDLIILAAAAAMDRDTLGKIFPRDLLDTMVDIYDRLRDEGVVSGSDGPTPSRPMSAKQSARTFALFADSSEPSLAMSVALNMP